ncbi:hypothetical protein [Actinomadura opuntiae]|uniref:hypothetical protein n=1 Tax=Actinomadura sp. OS1-43 TaxID=604315 RepID=UPI00255ABB90|nr:hypothetical protein [Actinomadura sp. OS1-43]MDL4817223.1 hypothetical protein [Actinomadura sp. OS1-43]
MGQADATVDDHALFRPESPEPQQLDGQDVGDATGEMAEDAIELAQGRGAPFSMLPDWVALSCVPAKAQALTWQLAMHLDQAGGTGPSTPRGSRRPAASA